MKDQYYIPKPSLKRLGYVAGVREMSNLTYEELRGVIKEWLSSVLQESCVLTNHAEKITINEAMMAASLPTKMWSDVLSDKTCKVYGSKKVIKVIEEIQEIEEIEEIEDKTVDGIKKRKTHKAKRGMKALREIRYHQKHSECLNIPRKTFSKGVRFIADEFVKKLRFSRNALLLLQYALENYIIELLKDANLCAIHAGRIGVLPKDIQIARRIRKDI